MTNFGALRFLGSLVLATACGTARAPDADTTADAADASFVDLAADASAAEASAAALSTHLTPTQAPAYYVAQGNQYFDALDRSAPADSVPTYSELVARWEWPPWLKLTGYTRTQMQGTDKLVKANAPAVVSHRDCRAFTVQPFGRCRVSFDYDNQGGGKPCPIYEEFTFNDQGEITFVEAWSDQPGLLPMADATDLWGEGSGVHRLSTRIPGLGNATGRIDPTGAAMTAAAASDPEIADFVARTQDFWTFWANENNAAGPNYFSVGCGWPTP